MIARLSAAAAVGMATDSTVVDILAGPGQGEMPLKNISHFLHPQHLRGMASKVGEVQEETEAHVATEVGRRTEAQNETVEEKSDNTVPAGDSRDIREPNFETVDLSQKENTEVHAAQKNAEEVDQGKNLTVSAANAGRCSAEDAAIMARLGGGHGGNSLPSKVADCGKGAYYWFSFHKGDMQTCVQKVGLSSSCAGCFADAGAWGAGNCKGACLFGSWCSSSCLGCTGSHNANVQACAGVTLPEASSC